ncbi:hypothetical protein KXX06_005468, partial [Aspergillus fumigatus]
GYVSFAAQTDVRMKALATISAVDTGRLTREGLSWKRPGCRSQGREPVAPQMLPDPKAVPEGTPDLFREGAEYYRTDRGSHPRANGLILRRSADYQANFEAFRFQHMLSPRPVLMIVGEMADTAYFSSDAIANSTKEPKELFVVP